MNPEVFAEFLSRLGHKVIETKNCYWYDAQPGFYFYFPYHRLITPEPEELNRILWKNFCIGARYFSPLDTFGKDSYMIVCSDKNYDFPSVDAKYARRQTRRGLEQFKIRQISFKELATDGFCLIQDTFSRQGRHQNSWSPQKWYKYCLSTKGLDGFEAWGGFLDTKLVSFLMAFQMEDYFTIMHQNSATEYLRMYPNNALIFSVTKQKLALPQVKAVSYGPQSLDAPESLDKFKFRMGFQQYPMKQRIVFNPIVKPFVNGFVQKLTQSLSTLKPESDTLRKLDGIVRFYCESC